MISTMIEAIRELFILRNDCYPLMLEGKNSYNVIKQELRKRVIEEHLRGVITIGTFQILDNKVKWLVFDIDNHNNPNDLEREFETAKQIYKKLKDKGLNPLLEFSGRGFNPFLTNGLKSFIKFSFYFFYCRVHHGLYYQERGSLRRISLDTLFIYV